MSKPLFRCEDQDGDELYVAESWKDGPGVLMLSVTEAGEDSSVVITREKWMEMVAVVGDYFNSQGKTNAAGNEELR